jgi:Pro-kumamolisin, activation domain/ell wall binding domain 2 (CWB2)
MHRAGVAVAGIVLSLVASVNAVAIAPVAPASAPTGPATTPVGAAPVIPIGATVDGAAPVTEPVSFEVVLRSRNQAALDAFTTAVSTPGSASYRHFLAPGQYASRFGPTASTIANVTTRLRALGLTVGIANGSIVPVSGSLSRVGAALHTSFRQYRLASGRVARANVTAPQLPTAVAGAVQAVVGLDSLAQFSHPVPTVNAIATTGGAVAPSAVSGALTPNLAGPTACSAIPGGPASHYYTAPQLASYYGLTASYAAGTRGSGVTVAILELEPFFTSDIANYQSCYGTSTTVTTTNVGGGPGTGSGSGEAALDIEDVIGLAPDAAINVYQAPNSATNVLGIYSAIASDDTAKVVTTSWGACEAGSSPSFVSAERTTFQQMATQGQSTFAASGDAGSADCDNNPGTTSTALAVDDPASQPFVTGVGGTTLPTSVGTETTWNNGIVPDGSGGTTVSAGGGGVSANWPMPSWQTALGNVSGSSGAPCNATGGTLCREVPDVSASADPNDGYAIFFAGAWRIIGGTSAAAPTWAAYTALVDASCGGHQLGLINPALYQLRAAGSSDFHDVTIGNNDGASANSNKYAAATGFDMATGLGSPVGSALTPGLCPAPSADGVGTMAISPTLVPSSSTATLTFTYTAPAGTALTNGKLSLLVPAGWSAPSVTAGTAGFTTASAGTVTVAGNTINVSGVATTANSTVTITYGNTVGGLAASTPTTQGVSSFATKEASTASGTLTSLSASPQVSVGLAPDGSGTLAASPTSVVVAIPTTLTFTYAPPAGGAVQSGEVTIAVPSGWTTPQITNSAAAGFVTASTGTLSIAGSTIRVTALSLSGTMLTVTYGDTGGGANPTAAATPPGSPTTSTFTGQQKGTSGGTLTSLASPPTVTVTSAGGGGGGGGGGGAPPSSLALLRVAGTDRVATSVAASQTAFPATHSARGVVLVRSDAFADALAGTPLAVSKGGPLLLTGSASLSTATAAELQRVLPAGGFVYLLGGTSALSSAVGNAVAALGFSVVRIAGPDRFTTAALVAEYLGNPTTVFEADGTNFPDALSAGTAAAAVGGVILLTAGSSQSAPTAAYLAAHPGDKRYAIGGPAVSADPSAKAFVGTDRFATSVLVAQAFFPTPTSIALASGLTFPDALSGGSVAAMNNGPMVLVPSTGTLPVTVAAYLATAKTTATAAWLFGGTSSVAADVFNAAASVLAAS